MLNIFMFLVINDIKNKKVGINFRETIQNYLERKDMSLEIRMRSNALISFSRNPSLLRTKETRRIRIRGPDARERRRAAK